MRNTFRKLLLALFLTNPLLGSADECWVASNIQGYSAVASEDYEFVNDGLPNPLLICFGSEDGTVSGTDTRLVKFGESTLAGYGGNDEGNELFEVYQIDRANGKLLYVKTRIGTKTINPILSDIVSTFVGDAVPASD